VSLRSDAAYGPTIPELEEYDERLREAAKLMGFTIARVLSQTSNVFSTGADWYVEGDKDVAEMLQAAPEDEEEQW
jgi:hypothetical protein